MTDKPNFNREGAKYSDMVLSYIIQNYFALTDHPVSIFTLSD